VTRAVVPTSKKVEGLGNNKKFRGAAAVGFSAAGRVLDFS
jgi:hypothetical protein